MAKDITKEMIERFLNGQCDEVEAAIVARYLKTEHGVLRDHLPDESSVIPATTEIPSDKRQERIWKRIEQAIRNQKKWLYLKKGLAAAAILGVLFSGAYFFYDTGQKQASSLTAEDKTWPIKNAVSTTLRSLNNTKKDKTVVLPDGTKILLQPGAGIEYPSEFKNNRNIVLTGKAFFDVAKDAAHPFTVTAAGIGVTALGTSFWITENEKDQTVNVHLVEGEVVVQSRKKQLSMQQVYLTPGQQLLIDIKRRLAYKLNDNRKQKDNNDINIETQVAVDAGKSERKHLPGNTVWSNRAYNFSHEPLRRVFDRIENRYHVRIELENDEIAEYRFTGKIMYTDSLDVLLNQLCRINGLEYIRTDKQIKIQQKQ